MFTILIEPIAEKDIWLTKVKRPIEIFIKKKYLKIESKAKQELFVRQSHYSFLIS